MQPAIVLSEVDVFKPFSEKGINFLAERVHRRELAKEMHVVKQLEERMYQHARELEFEQAAQIRDEIEKLKAAAFR